MTWLKYLLVAALHVAVATVLAVSAFAALAAAADVHIELIRTVRGTALMVLILTLCTAFGAGISSAPYSEDDLFLKRTFFVGFATVWLMRKLTKLAARLHA